MKGVYARTRNPIPSETRKRILDYITDFVGNQGYSPSYREIKEAVGLKSSASVQRHIEMLCTDGFLKTSPNRVRSLVPTTLQVF